MSYELVPYIFRAVRLRCNALSSVPIHIVDRETKEEREWPFQEYITPKEFLWKTEAGKTIWGAAFWLKRKRGQQVLTGIEYLNPGSMTVKVKDGKIIFEQVVGNDTKGPWSLEEMVYVPEYDPEQDIQPGVSPLQVALISAGLSHYMDQFASAFFEHGAMPVTLVSTERPVAEKEILRTERKINQIISGVANAFRVRILRGGLVNPVTLTQPIKDLAMKELDDQTLRKILVALEVPITMVDDAANFATAREHRMSFYQDTVRPNGEQTADFINRQLLFPLGLEMVLAFEEMDLFQEDEADRADSLSKLVAAKVPLDIAMEILGYDLDEKQWQRVQEQVAQGQELLDNLQAWGSQPGEPQDRQDPEQAKRIRDWPRPGEATLEESKKELINWQRKSLEALKDGRNPAVVWRSDFIPEKVASNLHIGLAGALTEDDVRATFDIAFAWLNYGA